MVPVRRDRDPVPNAVALGERSGFGTGDAVAMQALSTQEPGLRPEQQAAAILDRGGPTGDPGWKEIEASVPGADFFSYDYELRTFEVGRDGVVTGRGNILASYWTEIIPGFSGSMSIEVPATFEVDVGARTFRSYPRLQAG